MNRLLLEVVVDILLVEVDLEVKFLKKGNVLGLDNLGLELFNVYLVVVVSIL